MRPLAQRRVFGIAALLGAIAVPACTAGAFACVDDDACGSGVCQASGYCSFPDADCSSGQRYGEHAPMEFAGACVVPGSESSGTPSATSSGTSTSVDPVTTLDGTAPSETSSTGESSSAVGGTEPAGTTTSAGETSMSESSGGPQPGDCVVEEFDDAEFDDWYLWAGDGVMSGVVRGQLHLPYAAEPSNTGFGRNVVGVAGRVFEVEIVAGPNSLTNAQLSLNLVRPDDVIHMLVLESGTLAMLRWDGQGADVVGSIDVGDAPPRHWRVIATDASLTWQYAFEGAEFVELAVEMVEGVDEMTFEVVANTWQPEMAPGEAILERISDCPG